MSAIAPADLQAFHETMSSAQALKDREELVRKKCDELEEKQAPGSL